MKNFILLRCAGSCVILLSCLLIHAQVPQLKINDKSDPNVYLSKLSIDVKVVGNRAITNMTMVFTNKSNRILEGELVFPLPEGISVSRYALDINGKLREAVPVEKEKATQVFEEIERRRVDPGILEQVEGNNFRTRIYPVPARGSRTVAIGYEEELTLKNMRWLNYRLALDHKRAIDLFKLEVWVQSKARPVLEEKPDEDFTFNQWHYNYSASITKENFQLSKSLAVNIPREIDAPEVMMQKTGANYYFLVNNHFLPQIRPRKGSDNIAVIWDASLSGLTRNTEKEIELLGKYIEQKKNLRISLYLLNNNFKKNGEYVITGGDWSSLRKTLEKTVYDGGTDYSKIVLTGSDEYFFFSDGMSSLGYSDFGRVSKPVFAIVSSPRADYSYLQFIAQKTGGNFINLNNLKTAEALKLISEENLQFLGIKPNPNLSETYPSIATPIVNNFSLAGISTQEKGEITLLFGYGTTVAFEKTITLDFTKHDVGEIDLARAWAQKKIAELDIRFENNKELISFLGRQFSIVTRNTSLIVLETVHDYVRYDIQPPAELRDQFDQIMKGNLSARQNQLHMAMSSALRYLDELAHWWDRGYGAAKPAPRPAPLTVPAPAQQPEPRRETGRVDKNSRMNMTDSVTLQEVVVVGYGIQRKLSITGIIPNTSRGYEFNQALQGRIPGVVASKRKAKLGEEPGSQDIDDVHATYEVSDYFSRGATIDVKQWMPDRSYLKEIAKEKKSSQYSAYLKLRDQYLYTPTFYYDMAQFFFRQQDTITGLQVLTNMAEIDIENHELYKLLGFKLRETGQFQEAAFIFKKVLNWRPMEPQSYRDYGLALADAGKYQQAVDTFHTALKKNYEMGVAGLYNGFEEILVTEMNRVIALHKDELNLSGFDQKLIHAMPVDVRVVLSWNKNDTDIDLWVVDPNGEKCYYSNKNTLIGGRISNDFRRGYGPEQYMLKKAIPGKYQVIVNYFGEQQVKLSGPATVMAEIFTHYADGREERKIITLQMGKIDKNNGVMVGEFAFAK